MPLSRSLRVTIGFAGRLRDSFIFRYAVKVLGVTAATCCRAHVHVIDVLFRILSLSFHEIVVLKEIVDSHRHSVYC
jgi:hypothetical protein